MGIWKVNPPIKDGKNVWKKSGKLRFHFLRCCVFSRPFLHFEGLVDGEMGCCSLPTVIGLNRNIKSKHGHLPVCQLLMNTHGF